MPLYTFILVHEGESCVVQGRHSNVEGFASSWTANLPAAALPKLGASGRRALSRAAHSARFEPVPNRERVWSKAVDVEGCELRIYAVQTQP